MKVCELYREVTEQLTKAGCDSPAFDACCLLEDLGGVPHGRHLAFDESELSEEAMSRVRTAATRRASREPLQYILGSWDFLSLTLEVGDGVLIPRPDTELLCETASQMLKGTEAPTVLDLCAGSGCVGLGIWSLCPAASVTAVELYEKAYGYLYRNAARYPQAELTVIRDDVLSPSAVYPLYDVIVSNPPYIPSSDLTDLMAEVQHEPPSALDGEADGLRFYRAITSRWTAHLKEGGFLLVEIGIGQAEDVKALFREAGLKEITVFSDLGGIERVVCGRR